MKNLDEHTDRIDLDELRLFLKRERHRREKRFVVAAWTLIILGSFIMVTALGLKLYTYWQQNALIYEYEHHTATLPQPTNTQKPEPSSEPALPSPTSIPTVIENPDEGKTIFPSKKPEATAILSIPKIKVKVAVSEGTKKEILKYAAGHFTGTANPGESGNYALIAHRSYTYGQFFNRLDELKPGDEVYVTSGSNNFTYVITETFVVEPQDIWVLAPTKDAVITLITCTPIRIATHRLIVRGVLK